LEAGQDRLVLKAKGRSEGNKNILREFLKSSQAVVL
jgi:hypothetical protein